MKKTYTAVIAIMLSCCMLLLCGCQKTPEKAAVVSKNDGSFDAGVVKSATEPENTETSQGEQANTFAYQEEFSSTDGSVNFSMNVESSLSNEALPVVEVMPHYLTGEDAKRVANAVFGDVEYWRPRLLLGDSATSYTKSEIQACLNRWAKYTDPEVLAAALCRENVEYDIETVKEFIEAFTEMYESLPDEIPMTPCDWTLHPASTYSYSPQDLESRDISQDNDEIHANLTYNGLDYRFVVSTRNRSDFKINNISAWVTYNSPGDLDQRILKNELQTTEKPTEEAMSTAKEQVSQWLNGMNLGAWQVDSCESNFWEQENGEKMWSITVRAVPVLEDIPALRRPQIGNLRGDTLYFSNYYLTDAEFNFNADGVLLDFTIYSPVDLKEVVNAHAATLSMDELMTRVREHLSLSDLYEYGMADWELDGLQKDSGEKILCKVDLNRAEYGLMRVKVPNTDESYYYVPSLVLAGDIYYVGAETGTVYYELKPENPNQVMPLLALNAIDGSVINLKQS